MDQLDYVGFRGKSASYQSEEDVRAETNRFLMNSCEKFGIGINVTGHEVTSIFGGRADSIYSDVIVEYKAPSIDILSDKGFSEVVDGRDEKDRGLRHYLINFSLEQAHKSNELFQKSLLDKVGVGFNGSSFIFARFVASEIEENLYHPSKTKAFPSGIPRTQFLSLQCEKINDVELGFKKLFLYLRSTGRKRLSSTGILDLFGPTSEICINAIPSIYSCLCSNMDKNNQRVITLFMEWNRIFGDVYGDKETDFTAIKDSLLSLYNLPGTNTDIRYAIFTIQTYYNIILKLLAYDLLSSLNNPLFVCSERYSDIEILRLFSGKLEMNYNIQNFFELQFFEWFLYAEEFDNNIIQDVLIRLDNIEATASVIKPEIVEDVFREVYNGLMPKEVRHLLGEYYTPNWLVEFVLDQAGYNGQRELSILDPTCGSGSFVTHAIKRFLKANKADMNDDEIYENIAQKIVGYDINPITVITAKANYLLSLGDISATSEPINIPIYMCDSVLVPTVHAKQNEKSHSIKVNTYAGEFEIPVFSNRADSDTFMKEVSSHVENYTFKEFIEYLSKNSILTFDGVNLSVAEKFYNDVCRLHLKSKDGFWGIILKNAFAPLFSRSRFDIVIGNPPWIAWKAMSDTYRKQTLDIWLSYGIFEKNAYDKITTHDDFAMAVTYVSIDHYCKDNGTLTFVLPQTFLKASKGGEGFRKFCITRDGLDIPFSVERVYDMVKIQPFRGIASNKAAVIQFRKNKQMIYPMDTYFECIPNGNGIIRYGDLYSEAMGKFSCIKLQAKPINADDIQSPWLTMPECDMKMQDVFLGTSSYRGRKGIEPCGAKGIYLVRITGHNEKDVTIENLIERSRLQKAKALGVYKRSIEKSCVFPMVGGRNIDKWGINSNLFMVVPHYTSGDSIYRGMPEADLKINYPKTFEWLNYFRDLLLETRIRSGKFFDEKSYPFYRLDNVGPYTFMPFHVAWREQHSRMIACVISSIDTEALGRKVVVTDSKVLSCSFDNEIEAHYLCAIINSPTISRIIESYTINTQRGIDILKNISIPTFDAENQNHIDLAAASIEAHRLYGEGHPQKYIETRIDDLVNEVFFEASE